MTQISGFKGITEASCGPSTRSISKSNFKAGSGSFHPNQAGIVRKSSRRIYFQKTNITGSSIQKINSVQQPSPLNEKNEPIIGINTSEMPSLSLIGASRGTNQYQARSSNFIDNDGQFKTPAALNSDVDIVSANIKFATSTFEEEGVKFAHAVNDGHMSFN